MSVSKNVYIDKLNETSMYIDFDKESDNKSRKFKIGDNVRVSEYKNIFAKGYVIN